MLDKIIGGVVGGIATPFSNAWVATKNNQTEQHRIDKTVDRDITIANWQADVQLALAQRLLVESDRTHWSTRWIRPAFAGLSFGYFGACLLGVAPILPPPVEYVLVGIPGAIFLLRPLEKNGRTNVIAKAQSNVPAPRGVLSKITTKRADDA